MAFSRVLASGGTALVIAGAVVAAALTLGAAAQDDEQVAQAQNQGNMMRGRGQDGQRPDRCARLSEHLDRISKNLTSEQVRDIIAGRLAQSGMNTLKVGKVRSNNGVVSVDIVTTSGSLVVTKDISQKTGLVADLVQRCQAAQTRFAAMRAKRNGGQDQGQGHDGKDGHHRDGHDGHGQWMMRARFAHMHRGGRDGMGQFGSYAMLGNVGMGRDLNLNADQAKKLVEASVVMLGNPRLKVGTAKEKDADTLTVDVVTQDNALVFREDVDRHSGRVKHAS